MNKKKNIITLIALLLWMIFIYKLSAMPSFESNDKSTEILSKILETNIINQKMQINNNQNTKLQNEAKNEKIVNKLNKPFRKCAHASVYFVLSLLVLYALNNLFPNKKLLFKFVISLLVCFLYACTDEYHQIFVNGRTGQFSDVLIDMIGSILAILIVLFINKKRNIIKLKSTLNTKIS